MVLSHSSFMEGAMNQERQKMKLAKDVYINDEGIVKESAKGLPTGWAKGKLLGRKGQEISDAQAKEWGIGKKAKAPAENKSK